VPPARFLGTAPFTQPVRPLPRPQVMDLLGPSLWDVWNTQGQYLSQTYVACVAMEALLILQALHTKG
jgi:hypothetical protein